MLCTAHHVIGTDQEGLYRKTHVNHPSAVWVRECSRNYQWLYKHFLALCHEYTYRYGRRHLTYTKMANKLLYLPPDISRTVSTTEPPQCMPEEYKRLDVVDAYRAYYVGAKAHLLVYTRRPAPNWL